MQLLTSLLYNDSAATIVKFLKQYIYSSIDSYSVHDDVFMAACQRHTIPSSPPEIMLSFCM